MKIVVTTPTGNVGSRVVRLLLQAGTRPTLFLRDRHKVDDATRALVDVFEGDQRDAEAVRRATEGADAVYWVSPPTDAADPVESHASMGRLVADAVRENGVGRVVFQSSIGAEKRSGAGEIDGLAATEVALDATGAAVTHLRCGFFFTNLLFERGALEEGVLRVTWPVDYRMPWVDPRDIGDVAAARLLSSAWSGRVVQAVHGPADLSYADVASIVGGVLGRELRAEQIPDDDMRAGLRSVGMTEGQIEALLGMSTGLRSGFTPEDERTVLTTTPTTLASWAAEHLRG